MKTKKTISLRQLKTLIDNGNRFTSKIVGKSLMLYTDYAGRQITTMLTPNGKGQYVIRSNYAYTNKISHFTYAGAAEEVRATRSKSIIRPIIKKIKLSGVWQYIDKSFLIINPSNTRLMTKKMKTKVETELKEILDDTTPANNDLE